MLTLQAHAKINWALDITGRRPDGYHLLDMLMQSIALSDTLCVEATQGLSLLVDGAPAVMENALGDFLRIQSSSSADAMMMKGTLAK